jgi:hypothetical protein
MTAYAVFITAGEYSDRSTVLLCVCGDEQVAEAVKEEVWQEIERVEAILRAADEASARLELQATGDVVVDFFDRDGWKGIPVSGHLNTPRLDGFHWWVATTPIRGDGAGHVHVIVTECPTVGVLS